MKENNMPVVIFCGGYGSRIKEETIDKPKPMITVGGFPLLWHIMKIYKHQGFNNFVLTLGYKGDYIRNFLKSSKGKIFSEFNITCVETGVDTPTGGRLLRCKDYLGKGRFMCTYGDGVANINLAKLLRQHKLYKNIVGTLTGVRIPHKFGIISFKRNGQLKSYQKGHLMKEPVHSGFMVFEQEFLSHLKDEMFVEEPFDKLAKKGKMAVYTHPGFFGAVDTYKDLEDLNDTWFKSPAWKVWKD